MHITRGGADAAITEFQSTYEGDDYTRVEENWGAPKWVRYVSTKEGEGPSVYIEISKVME